MPSLKLRPAIFYGWWVVLACMVIQFYLGGTFHHGFTAFFDPLVDEFGWSHALVSLVFTFRGVEAGILAPIVGILVDRFGPRRLLLSGVIIMGLGFWLFSRIHVLWTYYAVSLVLTMGYDCVGPVVGMTAVVKWFKKRTGLAMGILTSGFGAGGLLIPAIVWLVDNSGWREAMVIFAVGAGVLGIPLALVVKDAPEEEHSAQNKESSLGAEPTLVGMTPREVLKTKDFWLLSMALLFGWVAGSAVIVYQVPHLVSVGITRQTAGFLTIILSVSNIVGRLLFGWLGDMLDRRHCFVIGTVLKAGGVFGFAIASTVGQFIPSLIALGLGFGGLVPLRPALQQEFFGRKAFATTQGLLMIFVAVGGIVSPVFAGWMFDLGNSYRPAFIILAGATLIAIPMVLAAHRGLSSSISSRKGASQIT